MFLSSTLSNLLQMMFCFCFLLVFFVALALTAFLLAALQRCSVAVGNQIPSDVCERGNSPICLCVMYINVSLYDVYIYPTRGVLMCWSDQSLISSKLSDWRAVAEPNVLTWDQSVLLPLWFIWRVFKLVWSLRCPLLLGVGSAWYWWTRGEQKPSPVLFLNHYIFWKALAAGLKMKTFVMFDQTCQMLFKFSFVLFFKEWNSFGLFCTSLSLWNLTVYCFFFIIIIISSIFFLILVSNEAKCVRRSEQHLNNGGDLFLSCFYCCAERRNVWRWKLSSAAVCGSAVSSEKLNWHRCSSAGGSVCLLSSPCCLDMHVLFTFSPSFI